MNVAAIGRCSLLGSCLLSSFLLWGSVARADIAITPMVVETEAKRGQAQGTMTVYNQAPEAFRARVYTAPFTYDKEQGFQALKSSPNDLSPYLQFSPTELVVPSSGKRKIRFIVRFPPNLPDGEYRTMIFTENLQATKVTQTNQANQVTFITSVVPRIGVTVYVRKGDVLPNLVANSARFNPKSNQVQLLVQNTGKASAVVAGNWTLKQGKQEISTGKINDTTAIAQGERYLLISPQTPQQTKLAPGEYQLSGELKWGEGKKNHTPFSVSFTVPQ